MGKKSSSWSRKWNGESGHESQVSTLRRGIPTEQGKYVDLRVSHCSDQWTGNWGLEAKMWNDQFKPIFQGSSYLYFWRPGSGRHPGKCFCLSWVSLTYDHLYDLFKFFWFCLMETGAPELQRIFLGLPSGTQWSTGNRREFPVIMLLPLTGPAL